MDGFDAICYLCGWTAQEEDERVAQSLSVWHVYEQHPAQWLSIAGDRLPRDPDPRTPWGRQKIRAEAS